MLFLRMLLTVFSWSSEVLRKWLVTGLNENVSQMYHRYVNLSGNVVGSSYSVCIISNWAFSDFCRIFIIMKHLHTLGKG